jgi:hypothetical protein
MITGASGFVSNLSFHNDLKISFVHEGITLHATKYKLHTTGHSNRLISELLQQANDVRKLELSMDKTWLKTFILHTIY